MDTALESHTAAPGSIPGDTFLVSKIGYFSLFQILLF